MDHIRGRANHYSCDNLSTEVPTILSRLGIEASYTPWYGCYDIYQPWAFSPWLINIIAALTSVYNLYIITRGRSLTYTNPLIIAFFISSL